MEKQFLQNWRSVLIIMVRHRVTKIPNNVLFFFEPRVSLIKSESSLSSKNFNDIYLNCTLSKNFTQKENYSTRFNLIKFSEKIIL